MLELGGRLVGRQAVGSWRGAARDFGGVAGHRCGRFGGSYEFSSGPGFGRGSSGGYFRCRRCAGAGVRGVGGGWRFQGWQRLEGHGFAPAHQHLVHGGGLFAHHGHAPRRRGPEMEQRVAHTQIQQLLAGGVEPGGEDGIRNRGNR